jgi:peptidoglycan hydrolase-like protein with peptidoglycan-binding domain
MPPSYDCVRVNETSSGDLSATVNCLIDKIKNLENRIKVLESKIDLAKPIPPAIGKTSKALMGLCINNLDNTLICPEGTVFQVDKMDGIKIIQSFLKEEGSFDYPTATGNYGTITKEAMKKFQLKRGLTPTGLVDEKTLEEIQLQAPVVAPKISDYVKQIELQVPLKAPKISN